MNRILVIMDIGESICKLEENVNGGREIDRLAISFSGFEADGLGGAQRCFIKTVT